MSTYQELQNLPDSKIEEILDFPEKFEDDMVFEAIQIGYERGIIKSNQEKLCVSYLDRNKPFKTPIVNANNQETNDAQIEALGNFFRRIKEWAKKWLFGFYLQYEFETPAGRWIIRPLRKAISFFAIGFLTLYLISCCYQGFVMSLEASSGYGLLIIRALAIIIFSILQILALPLTAGHFVLFVLVNSLIIFPLIGFVHGLTLNQKGVNLIKKERQIWDGIVFFILYILGLGILFIKYGIDFTRGNTYSLIHEYIFSSATISVLFFSGFSFWILRNLYLSYTKDQ